MGAYKFLASLPAVLGVAGFFAYLWAGQSRVGGEVLKRIIDKLRSDPHLNIRQYGALTPSKLRALVRTDERVRSAVNEGDRDLLRLLIILQYVLTALVLIVCAALVGVSIWLYSRPEPLSIAQSGPRPLVAPPQGILVDLDPLVVEWTTSGKEETVSVFLENVDSRRRSQKKSVSSTVRSVRFDPADVLAVATTRSYYGQNRVRSFIEWAGGRSVSEPKDVVVGIDVDLLLYGKLVTPDGGERTIHTLFATIDRSTQALPDDYSFKGDFVAMTATGPLVVPLLSRNSDGEVSIPGLDRVDWGRPVGFVFGGPDDPRLVRTHVSGKMVAREATAR